jgi:ParB-like chromosome segregation protein Spo0J
MATEQELRALREHVAKHGVSADDLMKRLSDTAKTVASSFGIMLLRLEHANED